MKHFFAIIHEMINGFETDSKHVVQATSLEDAEKQLNDLASTWRDDEPDWDDDQGYYFDGGGICVHVGRIQEITKAEFEVLEKFL